MALTKVPSTLLPQTSQFASMGVGTAPSGVTGEIRATNSITSYYSDERLKTKVGEIDNALDKLVDLCGFLYVENETAKNLGFNNTQRQVALSAQDVQRVQPEAVKPAPFDIGQNEDGTEYSLSGENYLTVQYELLIPLIVEAIKELKTQVDSIKSGV